MMSEAQEYDHNKRVEGYHKALKDRDEAIKALADAQRAYDLAVVNLGDGHIEIYEYGGM